MSHYPPGVTGAERYFHDPEPVSAFDVLDAMADSDVTGYKLVFEDFGDGKVVGLYRRYPGPPTLILSVREDQDHSWLLEALHKDDGCNTVIQGTVAVFWNHLIGDEDAAELLAGAIERAVDRISNHNPEEDHPDV